MDVKAPGVLVNGMFSVYLSFQGAIGNSFGVNRGIHSPFLEQANSSSNRHLPGAFSGSWNQRGKKRFSGYQYSFKPSFCQRKWREPSIVFFRPGCGSERQHVHADQTPRQLDAPVGVADQARVIAGRRAWAGARSVGAICTARRASPGTATRFKPGSYRLPALVRLNRPGGAACSSRACSERLRKSCEGSGKMTIATRRGGAGDSHSAWRSVRGTRSGRARCGQCGYRHGQFD